MVGEWRLLQCDVLVRLPLQGATRCLMSCWPRPLRAWRRRWSRTMIEAGALQSKINARRRRAAVYSALLRRERIIR